jgi:hypothetical protein
VAETSQSLSITVHLLEIVDRRISSPARMRLTQDSERVAQRPGSGHCKMAVTRVGSGLDSAQRLLKHELVAAGRPDERVGRHVGRRPAIRRQRQRSSDHPLGT